jgi:hypothetical protein
MERTPVNSSNVQSVGYDADSQVLEVEFNSGAIYQYAGVPKSEHDALMNSDSKGKYLHANIKNRFSHSKL